MVAKAVVRRSPIKGPTIDNGGPAFAAKVAIRQNVLNNLSTPGPPNPGTGVSVFDAFAGAGEMYSAVWRHAESYTGCDQKAQTDERLMFCADNRRVLRAIDLARFNVFDLDAYGSPWDQAIIIAVRRKVWPGETIGLVLTEGGGISFNMGSIPRAITLLTGVRAGQPGLSKQRTAICSRAIAGLAHRMNCEIVKRWQADGKTGAMVRYIGLVLRGR